MSTIISYSVPKGIQSEIIGLESASSNSITYHLTVNKFPVLKITFKCVFDVWTKRNVGYCYASSSLEGPNWVRYNVIRWVLSVWTYKVASDISSNVLIEKSSSSWMLDLVLWNIKDKIVKADILLSFETSMLKLHDAHFWQWSRILVVIHFSSVLNSVVNL